MPNTDDISVIEGSGNVFADLDLDDAEELQMKGELTRQIYHRIQALGLTQREAGKRLGLKQPEVSKLMKGRFTDFPTDRLLALLKALEVDVDIVRDLIASRMGIEVLCAWWKQQRRRGFLSPPFPGVSGRNSVSHGQYPTTTASAEIQCSPAAFC